MVAIFTGSGTGFERGSGNVLGSSGLLGSSGFGRSGSQVFLNAANGNLLINRQDEFLVGRGPDAGVARTYNSLGNMSDDNGDNWRQSTQRAVRLNGTANSWGSSVTHRMGDGSEVAYYWNGSTYTIAGGAGIHDKVVIDGAVLRWTDGDSGVVETYENDGVTEWRRLKTVADTSGNAVTYGYAGDKLTSITTADGRTIQYSWTGSHITQVNSGDGTLTRYFYDSYDRLSQVDIELTSGGSVYSTSYTYHGSSKLIATISETDGSSVSIAYDNDNRVTSLTQTVSSGVTRTTSLVYGAGYTSVTDPGGQVTTLSYDGTGALVQITAPPAYAGAAQQTVQFGYNEDGDLSSVTDSAGYTATYVRDSWGRIVSQVDRLDNILLRTFNAAHKALTETRPSSGTTRYVYDSADRLRFMISGEGNVVEYAYNSYGQKIYDIAYTDQGYDLTGLSPETALTEAQLASWKAMLADPSAAVHTGYVHDIYGNVTYVYEYGAAYSPGNPHIGEGYSYRVMSYDTAGRMLASAVAGQNMATYAYDGLGRVVASTDVHGGTTSFVFNDAQTQTVVTLANGLVQTSVYNKAGELVSLTESGSFVASGQGTATVASSYRYDKLGRLRMATDPSGVASYYLYDKAGRKVADINAYGVIEYRYDANNRLVATARYATGINGGSATLAQLADPDNSLDMAAIRPGPSGQDLWSWTVYDREGRVIETIEGDGSVTAYEYDVSGRLVRTTGYANKLTASQVASFQATSPASVVLPTAHGKDSVARIFYDKDGRTIGALDAEGYLVRTIYDRAGRKVQEIAYANATNAAYRANGTFENLIDSAGTSAADRSMRYVYDGQGLLRFTVDAVNRVTEYRYGSGSDAFGLVRQTVQYAGTLGALSNYNYGNVKSAVAALAGNSANRTSWAVYNLAGSLAYAIDANGAVTGYSYDDRGQVTKQVAYATVRETTSLPTQSDMNSWAGSAVSNSDRITRFYYGARGELRFTVDAEGYVDRTDYDGAGRPVSTYRWDNPVSASDGWTIATVSGAVSGGYSGTTSYYDAAGRLSYTIDALGVMHAYWVSANNLVTLEAEAYGTADERRTQLVYDAAGRLTSRQDAVGTVEQATTQFEYNGLGDLVSTTDANGHITSWTYDKLGRQLSETNAAGGVTTYEYNAFDEVVRTIDARGNSTWSYYDKLGRAVTTRDAEDYVTETAYTVFGEVDSVTRRYERATNTASVTAPPAVLANAKDATTSFIYDKLGRVLITTDAENAVEVLWYNAFGNVTQKQNKLGLITRYIYFKSGLIDTEYVNSAVYNSAGDQVSGGYYRNLFYYDARGNLTKHVEAYGLPEQRDTWFGYDRANRLILKEGTPVPVGQSGTMTTPAEHYAYDKRGNLIETWDTAGGHAWYYYDDLDRKSAEIVAVTASAGAYKAFSYDDVGNLTSSRIYGGWASLPANAGGAQPSPPAGEYRETIFSYDNINRLLSESVAGQAIGYWQNGSYVYTSGTLTTSYQYDAIGNVVKTTDPTLVSVYSYYDKLGRKTGQVDALGYATRWDLDAEGNVLTERRYSDVASGISASGYTAPAPSSADRVTEFEYDRMGRRLKEKRLAVEAWTLNTANGQLDLRTGASATSTIQYTYNALGQVLRKYEATGDLVTYDYDSAGRLRVEHRNSYVDLTGGAVTPSVRYYYNGIGLVRTEQGGSSASGADRVTTNSYGADGRLLSTTDAANNVRNYIYDAAGRKTGEYYTRDLGNGSFATEGLSFEYDRAGNLTRQSVNTIASGVWNESSYTKSAYNAYGEVTDRGTNGWQEQFAYDGAGRLIRTNSGDGVWRHFVYDAAGRQTLVIESEGMDLAAMTQAAAYGNAGADGVNTTVTVYDRRGQATGAIQRLRETAVSGARQDIAVDRGYNAFGELLWEEDAYDRRTDYTVNTMGRVIQIQRPGVSVTAETGAQSSIRPTEKLFYDISGRLIGTQDANSVQAESLTGLPGYKTTRQLLAGTGYGGGEAMVVKEWHPDGGTPVSEYDVFGDLRTAIDEIGRTTNMAWNKLGQLIQVTRPGGLDEYYSYDLLGNRIGHWNEVTGYAARERTEYDAMGRVTLQRAFGGDTTTTSYSWSSGIATSGMGTFGGWIETISTDADRASTSDSIHAATQYTDIFGRVTARTDKGGHASSYRYDLAGRMIGETASGGRNIAYGYYNTGQVQQIVSGDVPLTDSNWDRKVASYEYDLLGHLTREQVVSERGIYTEGHWEPPVGGGHQVEEPLPDDPAGEGWTWVPTNYGVLTSTLQDGRAEYDAAGRITRYRDAVSTTLDAVDKRWTYDAAGNVRSIATSYLPMQANGGLSAALSTQTFWYRYDSMNRLVTTKGTLVGAAGSGSIARGDAGTDIGYDAAGERKTAQTGWNAQETYSYDDAGRLISVVIGGVTRAATAYDLLGRVTGYAEYDASGAAVHSRYGLVYDPRGLVLAEKTATRQGSDWIYTHSVNHYSAAGTGGTPAAISWSGQVGTSSGSLLYYSETKNWKNGSGAPVYGAPGNYSQADLDYADSYTSQAYVWQDGAVQSYVQLINRDGTSTSSYDYDRDGALSQVHIGGGSRPRTIRYTTDLQGQVLRRDEVDQAYQSNDPHSRTYMFGGRQMGVVSNDGTGNRDYAAAIAERGTAPGSGAFRGGAATGTVFADFDANFTAFNGNTVSAGASSYTAGAGETLQSIAAQLWGDSALWYLLAEANGLSGSAALAAGTPLTIPGGVIGSHHNADTFKPYDPAEAIGNTSPNTPKPPSKKNCGAFGAIMVMAVAVAISLAIKAPVTSFFSNLFGTTAAAAGSTAAIATGVATGATVGAAASAGSQLYGMATGIQQGGFSWRGVALAGISGGVAGGLSQFGALSEVGKIGGTLGKVGKFLGNPVASALAGNALSQGIGLAIGLQSKFDFAGLAAAGVGALAGAELGGSSMPGQMAGIAADGLASAAARAALTGTDFGDNILAVLPGVVARTLGAISADVIASQGRGDGGFFSQVPEQVNELATSGAGVRAELAALVAGGPSLVAEAWSTSTSMMGRTQTGEANNGRNGPSGVTASNADSVTIFDYQRSGKTLFSSTVADFSGDGTPYLYNGRFGYFTGQPGNPVVTWNDYDFSAAMGHSANELIGLGKEFAQGAMDTVIGMASLSLDLIVSGHSRFVSSYSLSYAPAYVRGSDGRLAQRWENATVSNMTTPFLQGVDGAVLYDDFRPAARGLGAITVGGVSGRLGATFGGRLSATLSVESRLAAESGSAKFIGQGFNPARAAYLAEPYVGMGHHFVPRRTGLPSFISDSRLNVLKPNGISRGDFYELHYKVDPYFFNANFPKAIGGSWRGSSLGLEKYGTVGRIWYGSPTPLKVAVGGAAAAGAAGAYYYLGDRK